MNTQKIDTTWQTQFDATSVEASHQLQDKVKENIDKKIQGLSTKIKILETQKINPEQIKEVLKKEKAKMLQEAFDQALKDLDICKTNGSRITYLEIAADTSENTVNGKTRGHIITEIYTSFESKVDDDVNKFVDTYLLQQAIASGQVKAALTAIPAATATLDFNSPNPEIQRLQEYRAAREQTLDTSKKNRSELLHDEAMSYRATTAKIDELTSPNGGKIDDYDDGWNPLSKVTDENSPTRYRLNGYLYANYIFAGGGESGKQAVDAGIQKPYELYHSTLGDSRLTMKNLESDMGLKSYFELAKEFSTFDKPIGVMAGIWKLIDDNIKDPAEHKRYLDYVKGKFAELKTGAAANHEEKQLEILFGIESRAQQLHINPDWKNALHSADQLTDPTRDDAKITDYPGTFSANKDNPTRHQLTGYLYSVYLFNGRNDGAMQNSYNRAAKIYDDSGYVDKDFTQEDLEGNPEGKKDRFGLHDSLKRAESFTKYDQVKGVIAGLLKQADSIPNAEEKAQYQKYLSDKFTLISKSEGEDNQLMLLSTVRSPAESIQEIREEMRIGLLKLMIQASQQHNQFKFSPELSADFAPNKPTLTSTEYEAKAAQARAEIGTFIKPRSDAAMADLRGKYDILKANNAKLTTPLFAPADLEPLRLAVEDSDKKFNEARAVNSVSEFRPAVEDKYLEKLTNAEKTYIERATDLDTKLKAVEDAGRITGPAKKASTGSASGESQTPAVSDDSESHASATPDATEATPSEQSASDTTPSEQLSPTAANNPESEDYDLFTSLWRQAERGVPLLAHYAGKLIAKSKEANEKVYCYDNKGKRIAILDNDTEVTRTDRDVWQPARKVNNLNFVRVTYKETKMWIPEEYLSPKVEEQADETAAT